MAMKEAELGHFSSLHPPPPPDLDVELAVVELPLAS